MKELIGIVIATLITAIIGLIPEIVMYFIWITLNPTIFIEKLCVFALFCLFGLPFCVLFAILAVIIWAAVVGEMTKC